MPKPFSIQAPEEIAKQYAGNKQRIAEAARMGVVDPTAAILAGMFIDRMRGAQLEETMQPATVAQEVMGGAPPAAPSPSAGGLGMTPQAAPPMTPPPPMPSELGSPMPAPAGAPMGMAQGGMTYAPPYTQGGLDAVPLPPTMFDENMNGGFNDGYAGGGLVAFNEGGATSYYGRSVDPFANRELIENLYGEPQTKYSSEIEAELLRERSPEARKKARNLDLGYALMAAGSKMATTPGGLLQSLGAGIGEAAPVLMQSAKERKAEERDIRKGLIDIEEGRNTAAAQRAAAMLGMSTEAIKIAEGEKKAAADLALEREKMASAERRTGMTTGATLEAARMRASGEGSGPGPKGPTTAQANEQAAQMTKRIKAAVARADKAHAAGDYAAFVNAAEELRSSRAAYNIAMRRLGLPEMPPIRSTEYPKFKDRIEAAAKANRQKRAATSAQTPSNLPAGVTPDLWNVMTPEERKLFK